MSEMNLFEIASRKKFRFETARGALTTEQLWDLPLSAANPMRDVKVDLDTIARSVNHQLKQSSEESFVKPNTAENTELTLKLEILKHIIASKQKDAEDAKARTEKRARRQKLLAALEARDNQAIEGMSREQILKELEEID